MTSIIPRAQSNEMQLEIIAMPLSRGHILQCINTVEGITKCDNAQTGSNLTEDIPDSRLARYPELPSQLLDERRCADRSSA